MYRSTWANCLAIGCSVLILMLVVQSCTDENSDDRKRTTETRALEKYRHMARGGNLKVLGLDNIGQAADVRLGVPFTVYYIADSALGRYTTSIDPLAMLIDVHQRMYPVLLGQTSRALIVMEEDSSGFVPVAIGGTTSARQFTQRREVFASQSGIPIDSVFLVRIPALNVDFVGGVDATNTFQMGLAGRQAMFIQASDTVGIDSAGVLSARGTLDDLSAVAKSRGSHPW